MAQTERSRRPAVVNFSIDRDGELPLGTQLVWRIRGLIGLGVLRPGDRLPSVRELAGFSGANVNTARAAYAALEHEGLLDSQHGRGTFVAAEASAPSGLAEAAADAVAAAAEAGATPQELLAAVHAATPVPPGSRGDDEQAVRRALRAQIAHLERELAGYAWEDRRTPAPPGPETALPTGSVADAAALERTRDALLERLARLQREAERRGEAEHAARSRRAALTSDPAAHPWEVVGADEAGETGGGEWHVVPRFGPLGAIMGWWRVRAIAPGARGAPSGSHRG
jgi:DNA-binding transcriptional regulator YhcF (GntR family)